MEYHRLDEYCKGCQKARLATKDGPISSETGEPVYKAGEFIVQCKGIPNDEKFVPKYDKIVKTLSEDEITTAQGLYDPVIWAKDKIGWEPRKSRDGTEYQKTILRCSSKRKVLRLGRRLGKTEVIVISALHFLFNNSPKVQRWDENLRDWVDGFATILILTPYLSQQKLIFNRIRQLIDKNPELKNEIKRDVSTPFHEIELYNGAKIVGFSSGAKSGSGAETSRGQKADFIILDEMDYLNEADMETIIALLMEHSDVKLLCSSTPSGRRGYFYNFCMEKMDFKEFHYPSMVNPAWSPRMEAELREYYKTEIGWQHEILAEFGEATTTVFQNKYVEHAMQNYRYSEMQRQDNWIYSIGVDWNDTENGSKLVVTGWDPKEAVFRVVDKVSVQKAGWTQLGAIDELVKLNRVWRPVYIYLDEGYGATQIEVIKQKGLEARYLQGHNSRIDENLANVKGINFSSKIETYDPVTSQPIKKALKPFMVENTVRRFEQAQIKFSSYDEVLHKQLLGYEIVRVAASGAPVYEAGVDGDHELDALMLSLLAFQMELSEFTNREYSTNITFSGRIGESQEEDKPAIILDGEEQVKTQELKPQFPSSRTEYTSFSIIESIPGSYHGTSDRRIYNVEDFNNDRRSTRTSRPTRGRGIRRSSF